MFCCCFRLSLYNFCVCCRLITILHITSMCMYECGHRAKNLFRTRFLLLCGDDLLVFRSFHCRSLDPFCVCVCVCVRRCFCSEHRSRSHSLNLYFGCLFLSRHPFTSLHDTVIVCVSSVHTSTLLVITPN